MKKIILIIIGSFLFLSLPLSFGETKWSGDRALVILPDGKEISAEVARSEEERKRGLMFREELVENEGMLFVFEEDGFHSFWMKNCRMPLDIIWMDAHKRVVYLKWSAQPCKENEECPDIFPSRKARYVLEVKEGVAAPSNIKIGDEIILIPIKERSFRRSKG